MLEWLQVGAVAFGVGLSGALSPGPLTVLAMREGARRGWWAGPFATAGHAVAEATTIALLALGLSAYVSADGPVTTAISLVGGLALLWMAWGTARSIPTASLASRLRASAGEPRAEAPRTGPSFAAFRAVAPLGIAVSVANPYWVIWWATVGTKLTVDSLRIGWTGPAAVFAGHILSDLLWLTLVAALVGSGSRWMGDGAYRGLLAVCAAFLLVLGGVFLVSGARNVVAW
ncbi:MAG: LysE family transporter [Dehalococcoidia bacterium]